MSALDTTGAQLSARAQAAQQNIAEGWGQLSARAGKMFEGWGNKVAGLGEIIPTQANKETRAARKIQAAWRSCAARGHFHEERGAVLMLQSAQRRVKAQKAAQYKKAMKHWAAVVIQERYRRYKLKQKKQALENTPKKQGIGSKIVSSLSLSRGARRRRLCQPEARPAGRHHRRGPRLRARAEPRAGALARPAARAVRDADGRAEEAHALVHTQKEGRRRRVARRPRYRARRSRSNDDETRSSCEWQKWAYVCVCAGAGRECRPECGVYDFLVSSRTQV